jgi:hypothetical protein
MVGFALITVLSLLWMPRRSRKRGRFGRRSSALLRSLFPLVLGFGGWFLVALILLSVAPGVPIDGELLVVFSMGVPIARDLLGVAAARLAVRDQAPGTRSGGTVGVGRRMARLPRRRRHTGARHDHPRRGGRHESCADPRQCGARALPAPRARAGRGEDAGRRWGDPLITRHNTPARIDAVAPERLSAGACPPCCGRRTGPSSVVRGIASAWALPRCPSPPHLVRKEAHGVTSVGA